MLISCRRVFKLHLNSRDSKKTILKLALFRKIHNCGKKRITTRYDFCLRASHECLILQGEEKRKRRKSKKHQKAIARSFQEVHRPRRDLLGREREQKIIKKKEEGKKMERETKRSIVFCPFLSRSCHKPSTSNTTRSPITSQIDRFFSKNPSGILRGVSRDPHNHLASWLFWTAHFLSLSSPSSLSFSLF